MTQQLQPKYLNVKGAANYCGLSTRRIEQAVARGEITSFLKGKRRLILRESIDAWIEGKPTPMNPAHTTTPRTDAEASCNGRAEMLNGVRADFARMLERENASLLAALEALSRKVKSGQTYCACCDYVVEAGHAEDCQLAAALSAAKGGEG